VITSISVHWSAECLDRSVRRTIQVSPCLTSGSSTFQTRTTQANQGIVDYIVVSLYNPQTLTPCVQFHITIIITGKTCITEIKSYYGSLSGSLGCSFRIRHEKSLEASPGREIPMTSYPACKQTSLSRKSNMAAKKLLWITIMKS